MSQVYILILLNFESRPPLFLLLLLPSLKPFRVEQHVADPRCWDHSSSSTYLSAATGHFQRLATVCFLTIFHSVLSSKITPSPLGLQLFILTVCVFACVLVSCEEAEKLYLALSEWKCQEACKRKICVSLLCRFTWSFSLLLCQYLSMFFLRVDATTSITVFVLFVRAQVCIGVRVCECESKTSIWVLNRFRFTVSSPFALSLLLFPLSFSSSHVCWIFSVF